MNNGFSIIIPYHNEYFHVRQCLESVINCASRQNTYSLGVPFSINLIDDGSENAEFGISYNKKVLRTQTFRLPERKGFAAAVNHGIDNSKEPWIVILHSDCVIKEPKWLLEMYNCLQKMGKESKTWLVSAKTDNPPDNCEIVKSERIKRESESIVSKEALPLFCCMFPRKLIEKTGPIKEYNLGYSHEYLFWKMKKLGLTQGVSNAWVHHENGQTIKSLSKTVNLQEVLNNDRKQCLEDIKLLFGRQ